MLIIEGFQVSIRFIFRELVKQVTNTTLIYCGQRIHEY